MYIFTKHTHLNGVCKFLKIAIVTSQQEQTNSGKSPQWFLTDSLARLDKLIFINRKA